MMQLFVKTLSSRTLVVCASQESLVGDIAHAVWAQEGVPATEQRLSFGSHTLCHARSLSDCGVQDGATITLSLRLRGGIDFQNRVGSKPGAGGPLSASESAVQRRERLRKLALETIDLAKDPYFMRNHTGTFECKLCLTLHPNEGNYLAHTQGKRHQEGLARRAAQEAAQNGDYYQPAPTAKKVEVRKIIKIGRPGYRVVKQRDPETGQRSLLFEIQYPEIEQGLQPRHRFMSAFEQKIEAPDKRFQYLLFAAAPYETIGFKLPAEEIDKSKDKFFSNWDKAKLVFTLQIHFALKEDQKRNKEPAKPPKQATTHVVRY